MITAAAEPMNQIGLLSGFKCFPLRLCVGQREAELLSLIHIQPLKRLTQDLCSIAFDDFTMSQNDALEIPQQKLVDGSAQKYFARRIRGPALSISAR